MGSGTDGGQPFHHAPFTSTVGGEAHPVLVWSWTTRSALTITALLPRLVADRAGRIDGMAGNHPVASALGAAGGKRPVLPIRAQSPAARRRAYDQSRHLIGEGDIAFCVIDADLAARRHLVARLIWSTRSASECDVIGDLDMANRRNRLGVAVVKRSRPPAGWAHPSWDFPRRAVGQPPGA